MRKRPVVGHMPVKVGVTLVVTYDDDSVYEVSIPEVDLSDPGHGINAETVYTVDPLSFEHMDLPTRSVEHIKVSVVGKPVADKDGTWGRIQVGRNAG